MKTVFGEEIEIGDEIMYIYKSMGIDLICFGTVFDIEVKEGFGSVQRERLHVQKTYEIDTNIIQRSKTIDKNVILTNPMAFKCNQELKNPRWKYERKDS